jgi:hypothetical protein
MERIFSLRFAGLAYKATDSPHIIHEPILGRTRFLIRLDTSGSTGPVFDSISPATCSDSAVTQLSN